MAATINTFKSTGGVRRIWAALRYSLSGLVAAFRFESAFRQELALAVVLVPLACWLRVPTLERLILIGSILFVLIVELLNSAVETAVDRISMEPHPLAGRAKDIGSAAVLLSLLLCALVWVMLAGPQLLALLH